MAHQSSLSGEPNGSVDHPSHVDADRPGQVVARSPFTPVQSLNGALDPHLAQSTAHYYLTAEHPAAAHARSIPADHISYYTTAQPTHELPIPPPPQPTVSSPKRLHPDSHPQPYPPVPTSNQGGNNVASTSAGVHGNNNSSTGPRKKRRTGGGAPEYEEEEEDVDGDGQTGGARHWTDDEKTTLFSWLMAAGQDDHFDALRTKKNTCFRECAQDAFGGRKSFLAVKGCYERNFAVFKNIFAFEEFTANMAQQQPPPVVDDDSEVDRLREYERRIFTARKAGFNIGSMSSRLLDHWHRTGWYGIFHARWHNDPTLRRPPQAGGVRAKSMAPPSYAHESHSQHVHTHDSTPDAMPVLSGPPPPHEQDYAPPSEVSSPATTPAIHAHAHYPAPSYPPPPPQSLPPLQTHLHAQSQAQAQAPQQHQSHQQHQQQHQQQQHQQQHHQQPIHIAPIETQSQNQSQSQSQSQNQNQNMAAFTGALHECVRLLQAQVEDSRVRLEYARRREEREAAEFETAQRGARVKEKSERALEILSNPHVPEEYKQSAGEYLKKFFAAD